MTVDQQHLPEGFEDPQTEDKRLVGHGIEWLAGRQYDERTIYAVFELVGIVPMGVVNERTSTGWRHADHKRLPRIDRRRRLLCRPGPTGNPVVVAFEFNPMPVNCGRLRGAIDQFDFYWLDHGSARWAGRSTEQSRMGAMEAATGQVRVAEEHSVAGRQCVHRWSAAICAPHAIPVASTFRFAPATVIPRTKPPMPASGVSAG